MQPTRPTLLLASLLCVATVFAAGDKQSRTLSGSWCVTGQDLKIAFLAKDSVVVSSTAKDGVNGRGVFARQDTMFVATVSSSETSIRMGYRYDWQSDTTIKAKLLFMTVDGDSVDLADSSVVMRRCDQPKAKVKSRSRRNRKQGS
jgi:hypothetical protein